MPPEREVAATKLVDHHSILANAERKRRTVAIMQPYFIPYAGYFRLLDVADVFVVYDCVQFPRRGWVHRNLLRNGNGDLRWFTLPIEWAPRDARIANLRFATDSARRLCDEARRFPVLDRNVSDPLGLREAILNPSGSPVDYIEDLLHKVAGALDLRCTSVRSSSFAISPRITGEARILEILRLTQAERYVNAPGGRALYDARTFEAKGIDLRFLQPYLGSTASILTRLLEESVPGIAAEIRENERLVA